MVSWYTIIYRGICSKEYKESTYVSVKCGRFKKPKRAWLDTLIKDMDTWPDNSVKLFKCILRSMCEMYPISQQGCIVQRFVYYYIQVNWNYVSLNESLNRKILLLCVNLQVYLVVIVYILKWRRISYFEKRRGIVEVFLSRRWQKPPRVAHGKPPRPVVGSTSPPSPPWLQGRSWQWVFEQRAPRAARGVFHGLWWPDFRLFIRKGANLYTFSSL